MDVLSLLALPLCGAAIVGMVYQIASGGLVWRFMRSPRPRPSRRPSVTVLKPLCGDDPQLAGNLRSLCEQDYPRFQVVFGVSSSADEAVPAAEAQVREAKDVATLVVDERRHGTNLKLGNLLNMFPKAGHEVIAIADSDVAVGPGHLDDLVAPFEDPRVGIVTCLYVGRPVGGTASWLGAMGINHGFLPSALVARALGRKDGCFGATMALKRQILEAIGGFSRFKDILADDWALGAAVRSQGLEIALAARPVDLVVHEASLGALFAHEVRWGRTIAAIDRVAYMGMLMTQPVLLGLATAVLGGGVYWCLPAIAALIRLGVVRLQERALLLPRSPLMLLAVREGLNAAVFIASLVGRSVLWRGRRFRICQDGTIESLEGHPT